MSNLPTPTSSAYRIPSPSVSSSRRTSLDTIRSSTVGSPALGPTNPSAITTNVPQLAQARRNRAALRDYYGLKSQTQPTEKKEDGHEAQTSPSELDADGFNAEAYIKGILQRENLEEVLQTESNLISGM
jgi:vacuolar protein sorting-associated protein 51